MSRQVNVVHFPHPGAEHKPGTGDRMAWNDGRHARKFLLSDASWIDGDDSRRDGQVTFWGEWEPPSRILSHWEKAADEPTALHAPLLTDLPDGRELQNTDPLVFGDRFRYSNCKQFSRKLNQPTGLQELEPGSVILFGSKAPGRVAFVLDTVFVVATARAYSPGDPQALGDDDFLRRVVVEPLRTFDEALHQSFTLYEGATPNDSVEGMFSFVPCLPVEGEPRRFARPTIELPGVINPKSIQAQSGFTARARVPISDAKSHWQSVVKQVRQAGCQLGFGFPEPHLEA